MAATLQQRRGDAIQNDAFTGANGELTVDTSNKTVRVHDGATAGGTRLATYDELVALPNAIQLIGAWDPSTNTVTGDTNNTSVTKGVAPQGYPDPDQKAYAVSADGDFDLNGGPALESFLRGDQVIWSDASAGWIAVRGAGGNIPATDISFDNTGTSLVSTTVQAAIVEADQNHLHSFSNVGSGVGKVGKDVVSGDLQLRSLIAGGGVEITISPDDLTLTIAQTAFTASDVVYDGTASGLAATEVQSAIDEALEATKLIGEVKQWLLPTAPTGYLVINGQTSAQLLAAGYPILAGMFPGGLPSMPGNVAKHPQAGRAVGTFEAGSVQAHSHTINHDHPNTRFNTNSDSHAHTYTRNTHTGGSGSGTRGEWIGSTGVATSTDTHNHYVDVNLPSFSGTSGDTGSPDNAVNNIAMLYIIRHD